MHHGMGSNIDGIFVSQVKGIEHMCKMVIEEGNAKMHGEIRVRLRGKEQGGEEEDCSSHSVDNQLSYWKYREN